MIGAVVDRLRGECPSLVTVEGIGVLALLKPGEDRGRTPAAYVHRHSDRGGPNRLLAAVDQRLDRRIGVMLSLTATGEKRAGAGVQDLEVVIGELRAALVGWQPEGAAAPFLLDSAALHTADGGVIWWLELFAIAEHLRRV